MTEQPDTAAIRERWAPVTEVIALCDALDAARAERDRFKREADKFQEVALSGWPSARAEAAELTGTTLRRRLVAAESDMTSMAARIAAAREILRDAYDRGDFEAIERALTGDTQPVPEVDICKYPGCRDRFMTTHHVTDSYFDNDPDDDTGWPMLHASATTDKIHIHAVWCRRYTGGTE